MLRLRESAPRPQLAETALPCGAMQTVRAAADSHRASPLSVHLGAVEVPVNGVASRGARRNTFTYHDPQA